MNIASPFSLSYFSSVTWLSTPNPIRSGGHLSLSHLSLSHLLLSCLSLSECLAMRTCVCMRWQVYVGIGVNFEGAVWARALPIIEKCLWFHQLLPPLPPIFFTSLRECVWVYIRAWTIKAVIFLVGYVLHLWQCLTMSGAPLSSSGLEEAL